MIKINHKIKPSDLKSKIQLFWDLSGEKIKSIQDTFDSSKGSPVFTINGKYTTRGWTEWTQGLQYGSQILQFDATGEGEFLEISRRNTVTSMATHVSDFGVHDHGFNNVSTYGNLYRLMNEGKISL
ncbi:glycosyl hydrolase, partial [bacterium]|nr:glycosyl hydrolase [bacterium]